MKCTKSTRRQKLALEALDPTTGKTDLYLWFKYKKIQLIGRRSRGQIKEAAYIVPWILSRPRAVFEGLCWDNDESGSRGVGWRCYCGLPNCAYKRDGTKSEPYEGEVFLVFVDDTSLVYNWRWEKSAFAEEGLPNQNDLQHGPDKRFKRRLL